MQSEPSENPDHFKAVAELYHNYLTSILLYVAANKGAEPAGDLSFAMFRHQHLTKFHSSFEKLGVKGKPDAVACAQYHYLSNAIGGVGVEYMYESDRKAWIRFRHPRWIYQGTALAGIPKQVSHGFLKGWYAHNGVTLGNPRLGFVCTSLDTDGQYGFAGYFYEYDHDLTPEERLRFAPGEVAPPFDPALVPELDGGTWPELRLQKANRNYSMDYIKTILPEISNIFGPLDTVWLGGNPAQLIGREMYQQLADWFGVSGESPMDFARLMGAFGAASGDQVSIAETADGAQVSQSTWRLMRDRGVLHPSVFDAWNGLWIGLLAMHNRFLVLDIQARMDHGDEAFIWRIRPRGDAPVW